MFPRLLSSACPLGSALRGAAGCSAVLAAGLQPAGRQPSHAENLSPSSASDSTGRWSQQWNWQQGATGLRGPRCPGTQARPGEPVYTRAEVAAHDGYGGDGSIWVTYRDGVYDVTRYAREHPGGSALLQGAGGPVERFWAHWAQHHMSAKVEKALAQLRVGRLAGYVPEPDDEQFGKGAWEDEQADACRIENRRLTSRYCEMPYVSETRAADLRASYLTPNEAFYVRNHAPVPRVECGEAHQHVITFYRGEDELASLSLSELAQRFPAADVLSVLQCSGNRGADNIAANGFARSGFVGGPFEHIGLGLLGNAYWGGVRLADVLREVVLSSLPDQSGTTDNLNVTFEGLDGYSTSTPLRYVMDPANNCLLATHMNGVPLPPDHGFPVRALLPGITGARQVKWVSLIIVGSECASAWNSTYYRDGPGGAPLQELPLNSMILSPEPGAVVPDDTTKLLVRGAAYSGGVGTPVAAVELSADRGKSWTHARCLFDEAEQHAPQATSAHGWLRFEAEVQLPAAGSGAPASGHGSPLLELWCRATTASGLVQPEVSEPHGGYFYNGYHKVPLVRSPAAAAA